MMEIIKIPMGELTPDPNNAKDHPRWQVDQIKASIEQFGNLDPIGVWGDENLIVEGHGRFMALQELGYQEAECIRLDWLTEEERKAYALAHNKLTMNSGFDPDLLKLNLDDVGEIDMSLFGFRSADDWFTDHDKNDTSREEGNEEYNEFLDKFEPKKTTDDCYTPESVYNAVADWVVNEYGLDRSTFVRPFYPGGDYQNEKYPEGSVVVDNPPFSILTEIMRFYIDKGIKFFLFAPTLTLFSARGVKVCYIAAQCDVTYENGAKVNTSFITNLNTDYIARTAPELHELVEAADKQNRADLAKPVNLKYKYPPYVITAAMLGAWSEYGVDFKVKKGHAYWISALDAQKEYDKAIFGAGFLLSEAAKADAEAAKADAEAAKADAEAAKADAEAAKALKAAKALGDGIEVEPDGSIVWRLSDREKEIIRSLGGAEDES